MAFRWFSIALRGSLAGLVAFAGTTATFGAEAEGVVRIRSNDVPRTGIVIRGQSPNDCVPGCAPVSQAKTSAAAPAAALTVKAAEPAAPEPRVTRASDETAPATGEYANLFNPEGATPIDSGLEGTDDDVTQTGHRAERKAARRCKHGHAAGQCPEGCPAEIICPPQFAQGGQACPPTTVYGGEMCPPAYYGDCPPGCGRCVLGNNCIADHLRCHAMNHRMRNRQCSDALCRILHDECEEKFSWFRCKFGYFFPSGTGGKGSALAGHYSMVYPVNPGYADPRDCQVYSAQGYYGPVAVPLAPVVHHTYNYGWGVPSSRLTPVSHPVNPYPYSPY
jgi:hypothetical protein